MLWDLLGYFIADEGLIIYYDHLYIFYLEIYIIIINKILK